MDAFFFLSVSPSSFSLLFLFFLTIFQVSIANPNSDTNIQSTSCAPFDCETLGIFHIPSGWTIFVNLSIAALEMKGISSSACQISPDLDLIL
ncbi:hypothetical protein V6N11_059513 [Hibiscus sabdariffa]|uniref:Uncharacterized protein n=1 Tax=Hibiscus sabdariffa TaxID=183260 RepID=A0ABR1ZDA0_9ROSI